ncbi:MAG: DUF4129 domain-containing protein [Anaeromyxobacter sp.]
MLPRLEGIVAAALAAASSPDRLGDRARQLLEDEDLQRALPSPKPPDVPRPSSWDLHLPDWLEDLFDFSVEPLALLVRLLIIAGAAVLVALLVVAIARAAARLGRRRREELAPEEAQGPVEIPIASARSLAAQGRWDEAIHSLLLETLQALSAAARLTPSLTSREILAQVALPDAARQALAGLVAAVEISRFGGEQPGQAEYQACLAQFQVFLAHYRDGGQAARAARSAA